MRLYISGPMSGLPEHNFPAFARAATLLRAWGYDVVSPAELDPPGHQPGSWSWDQYLRRDLKHLVDCDAVATLPGWTGSRGATLEVTVADRLGMEVGLRRRWCPPLVGLCGYAGAGKDSLAAHLIRRHDYSRVAFADPLKDLARHVGWDGVKDGPGRALLQRLGVGVRQVVGESTWLDLAVAEIRDIAGPTVVTDVRFPNEVDVIRKMGGLIVRVDRPGFGPANRHVSEHAWTAVEPDLTVRNAGTVDDLAADAARVARHASMEVQP